MDSNPDLEAQASLDHLFREKSGQLTATLTRILGLENLDLVEDAVQDAFVTALRKWPFHGIPDNPSAWIVQVARNRALDILRRKGNWGEKRQELERSLLSLEQAGHSGQSQPSGRSGPSEGQHVAFAQELRDDQLKMIFACCHPSLPRDAQVALTLKTVGGLSVSEIARAFLTRNTTVAQRLVRAKRRLRTNGVSLQIPPPRELAPRLDPVLEVLYLLFNEGYSALDGEALVRQDLCQQAIAFASLLAEHPVTGQPVVHALLALFLFQTSRLQTRVDEGGDVLLLPEQDRALWDKEMIRRGAHHLHHSAAGPTLTRFHLEAEIACCHAMAPTWKTTDWPSILAAYDALMSFHPTPIVALNRAVAISHVQGPKAGVEILEALRESTELKDYAPFHSTYGELLARCGQRTDARAHFERALELTASLPGRRFLLRKLGR